MHVPIAQRIDYLVEQMPELCLAYISRLTPKSRMICRLTPKSCLMYAGLRLAKTFVCCCPDQLNKRLADSKIESVRRLLCSVRTNSTFVVASSQSQHVAFMTRSVIVTFAINNIMADWLTEELGSLCTKTFAVQCARVKDFGCAVYAIPQRLSFVVVLPYKNFCWLMYARH